MASGRGKLKFKGESEDGLNLKRKDASNHSRLKREKKKIKKLDRRNHGYQPDGNKQCGSSLELREREAVLNSELKNLAFKEASLDEYNGAERSSQSYASEERVKNPSIPTRQAGIGSILSSQTVISGDGTNFLDALDSGDVIVLENYPEDGKEEARVITGVFSQTSLSIHKPFSINVGTSRSFSFLKKIRDEETEKLNAEASEKTRRKDLKLAIGSYFSADKGKSITYRERKTGLNSSGGYKIVTMKSEKELSHEEQLDIRTKKKGDRYC